jgi:hypothetical protein
MSGIEVAGLALGAIPVLLEAIKTYRDAQDKIQTFKQSTKQLQIVDAQFRVCRLNFLNECRLLLDLILSNQELSKEMIRDVNHPLWEDKHVRLQFEDILKEHVDACATIVLNTHSVVQELDTRLSKFQVSPVSRIGIGSSSTLTCNLEIKWGVAACADLGYFCDGEESIRTGYLKPSK